MTSSEQGLSSEPVHRAGRYELRERIGEGGMGVVYAAFDPKLQRKLAVKFVIPRRDNARARESLLREAQALAQISHPNVVSVHDAGESEGQVFMAMDYIEGMTLTRWVGEGGRTWAETVAMFVQAGRGLEAAHEMGMVHRDFKPDNVLVDGRGVAQVVDFGLASELEAESESSDPEDAARTLRAAQFEARAGASEGGTLADDTLTRSAVIVGTPAYMAPEQREGRGAGPRSDQFAFCVALFEGVFRHRPEEGEGAALTSAAPLAHKAIPQPILAALQRGLSTDPAERWPSMGALLEQLEHVEQPARGGVQVSPRLLLGGVAVLSLAVLAVLGADRVRAWWSPVTLDLSVSDARVVEPMALHTLPKGEAYVASIVANKGRVEFEVELPSAGRYYLHALAWEPILGGTRGDADSFFVYVDGGRETLWHFGCQNEVMPEHVLEHSSLGENWAWQPVLSMANADSDCEIERDFAWELDAGSHLIVFRNREDAASTELAARLARVVLTNQRLTAGSL